MNLTVNEGDSIQLNCTMSGNPLPEIRWLKNRTVQSPDHRIKINFTSYLEVKISNSVLTIASVKKSDEGMYWCLGHNSVENIIGSLNHSEANLTVQGN